MAQYKVPQDVEADDKLLGPFSFRQFVYLLIAAGLIALAVGLFQIFPLLAIIPLPPVLLFAALALPIKKDQPMETYLAALVSFYLKPRKRVWTPGQRESTIDITAPKIVEASRTRDITGEEATHRLSFLANIVDTGGYAIKGAGANSMREDLVAEANATSDMFESGRFGRIGDAIARDENERHADVVREMRQAIEKNENMASSFGAPMIQKRGESAPLPSPNGFGGSVSGVPSFDPSVVVLPGTENVVAKQEAASVVQGVVNETVKQDTVNGEEKPAPVEKVEEKVSATSPEPSIIELANNPDFSVATIAEQAKRIKERDKDEVFISLH